MIVLLVNRARQLNELLPKVLAPFMVTDVIFDAPKGLVDALEQTIVLGKQVHSRLLQDVPKQAQLMVNVAFARALESFRLDFQDGDLVNQFCKSNSFTMNTEVSALLSTYEQRSGKNPILPRTQW